MARLVRCLALGACVALVVPAAALAKPGHRTFDATYPFASKLCAKVQAGQVPPSLSGDGPQLVQACSSLESAFGQGQTTLRGTQAQLLTQLKADRDQARAACVAARQAHQGDAACRSAWQTFVQQRQALQAQLKSANQQYFAAAEAARKAFWSTVRSLRGGNTIRPDRPVKR